MDANIIVPIVVIMIIMGLVILLIIKTDFVKTDFVEKDKEEPLIDRDKLSISDNDKTETTDTNSGGSFFSEEMMNLVAFKENIRRNFEEAITDTINQTKGYDNVTIGLSIQTAINCTSKALKMADFKATGMSKQETDKIIDEVAKSIS